MKTPLRVLRRIVDDMPGASPKLSQREQDRRARILTTATTMFAEKGPHTVTLSDVALAVRIPRYAVRNLFPDLDNLLATIIKDHLARITDIFATVPLDTPMAEQPAAYRSAYLAATRNGFGAPLLPQIVTTRYAHLLPEDELTPIEETRTYIAGHCGGADIRTTLDLLDHPRLTLRQIEACCAALEALPEPSWAEICAPPLPAPKPPRQLAALPPLNRPWTPEDIARITPGVEHGEARAGP